MAWHGVSRADATRLGTEPVKITSERHNQHQHQASYHYDPLLVIVIAFIIDTVTAALTMPPRPASSSRTKTAVLASTTPNTRPDIPSTDAHLGLLFEHFTYNPRAYIDSFIYKCNECLVKRGQELEASLLAVLPAGDHDAHDAEADTKREEVAARATFSLLTLLDKAVDHISDILELYSMQHVFGVTKTQTEYIVLPHHDGLNLIGTEAQEESRELDEKQRELNAKLNAAKATQHALTVALEASKRRVARTRAIRETLLDILSLKDDNAGGISASAQTLQTAIAKMNPVRGELLDALDDLRAVDPLGKSLVTNRTPFVVAKNEMDDKKQRQPWDQGREGYLRWQTQRYLSLFTAGDSTPGKRQRGQGQGDDADDDAKTPAKRRASARKSTTLHDAQDGMVGDEVGQTGEMERLAGLLRSGQ